jgi:hypothetical protein
MAQVTILDSVAITIARYQNVFGNNKYGDPEINWPSIGGVNIEKTQEFIEGMQKALEIAKDMSRYVGTYEVIYDICGLQKSRMVAANEPNQIKNNHFFRDTKILSIRRVR